jgi:hypothetical protein
MVVDIFVVVVVALVVLVVVVVDVVSDTLFDLFSVCRLTCAGVLTTFVCDYLQVGVFFSSMAHIARLSP